MAHQKKIVIQPLLPVLRKYKTSYRRVQAATGISVATLSRINRGHARPSWETLEFLCNYLGCELSELVLLQ